MTEERFIIRSSRRLAPAVYEMVLEGKTEGITAPGQFVNIRLDGCYLRRPLSIGDWNEDSLTLIFKVVGKGTAQLAEMRPGQTLDLLIPLGNGYDLAPAGDAPLLIGGGVGIPPMYGLCRRLLAAGRKPRVILGFNTAADVFYEEAFRALGAEVTVTTADGSYGVPGFVTAAMDDAPYTYFYTCGPMAMFRAVNQAAGTSGQFSFEERMGCGFGACMGCTCKTLYGAKRICKDGPVLVREEIVW